MTAYPRTRCPSCGRDIAVAPKSGRFIDHSQRLQYGASPRGATRCEMSGLRAPVSAPAVRYAQLRVQYGRNAAQLTAMGNKAITTGRPVNGFQAPYLMARAAEYRALSVADDATIAAHLKNAADGVQTALAARGTK